MDWALEHREWKGQVGDINWRAADLRGEGQWMLWRRYRYGHDALVKGRGKGDPVALAVADGV